MNSQHLYVGRNLLVLENMHLAVADIFVSHVRDGRGLRYAVDIKQRGEHHPDFYRYRKVRHDGERKCGRPNGDFGIRQAQYRADFTPLAHVVGYDEQNRRQRREWNKAREGGGYKEDYQK